MEKQFLYGAAVQGIQSFIFQTNKLKDIAGASELVNHICTDLFKNIAGPNNYTPIVLAAGNIKVLIKDEDLLDRIIRDFPMTVMQEAPGITISQAVVEYHENDLYTDKILELEDKLRQERNRITPSTEINFSIFERNRQTGNPAIKKEKGEWLDASTQSKRKALQYIKLCDKSFNLSDNHLNAKNLTTDFSEIANDKSWIAVIHADGNGLGRVVQEVGKQAPEEMSRFSAILDETNKDAAREAFSEMVRQNFFTTDMVIPIRPIVLGGDDFTAVCNGNFAIEYVTAYIQAFEKISQAKLSKYLKAAGMKKISICSGIAFIKSSYPFHYGYNLAETLCSVAKKDAKSRAKEQYLAESCIMFHKVESSFIEDFDKIEEKELTNSKGTYKFGPYYINKQEGRDQISDILHLASIIGNGDKENNKIKSHIRQWMTLMADKDTSAVEQRETRVKSLMSEKSKALFKTAIEPITRDADTICYRAHDILTIASIKETNATK